MSDYQISTDCLHAGYRPGNGEPRNFPIVQSTTFRYETSEEMGKLFDLEASGYFYTRLQNPTNDTVAAKICALEGGSAAMLLPPSGPTPRRSLARPSPTLPSPSWISRSLPRRPTPTACPSLWTTPLPPR